MQLPADGEPHPLLVYRVSLALIGQAGVMALELLHTSAVAVGAYAAAMGAVSLAAVLATSASRAYDRELSLAGHAPSEIALLAPLGLARRAFAKGGQTSAA